MENHSLDSLILIQYRCIESHEPYSYALCYQNLIIDRLKPIANNLDFKLFAKDHQVVNNYTWLTLMLDSCSLMLYSYGQVLHGSLGKGF